MLADTLFETVKCVPAALLPGGCSARPCAQGMCVGMINVLCVFKCQPVTERPAQRPCDLEACSYARECCPIHGNLSTYRAYLTNGPADDALSAASVSIANAARANSTGFPPILGKVRCDSSRVFPNDMAVPQPQRSSDNEHARRITL